MRRKLVQPLPNLFFADRQLSIPGFIFETATTWDDTGSQTLLAVGTDLKDGSEVLAKIAPATGSGAICLEREAHILDQLSGISEATAIVLRVTDLMTLPKESGDCVILLLSHPGPNLLGRYFPPHKVNELLLGRVPNARPSPSLEDIYVVGEPDFQEDYGTFGSMDLASFLEFAIQSTHCLEILHKQGIIHREIRANAFHLNGPSEQLGGPSALVIAADSLEEFSRWKVKEALCYLAPEQTGSIETSHEDHRTDLYSLGILFWTLLSGQGQMPFEGSPTEILHAIAQKRPMPVHEFRRDVPHVVAVIIEKLLAKSPDDRYNSAYGLKADLLECQRRLLIAVSSPASEQSLELIPSFEIGLEDKYMGFTIPNISFGRENEQESLRIVIRQVASSHARHYIPSVQQTSGLQGETGDDCSESALSSGSDSTSGAAASLAIGKSSGSGMTRLQTKVISMQEGGSNAAKVTITRDGQHSRTSRNASKSRLNRTRSVIVAGPAGVGKSSLILANQAKWRSHGLWGHAKFEKSASAPFTALLSCLSSVLRQLMIFQSDLQRFVVTLQARLGPLLHNAPLLYEGAPVFKDVLQSFGVDVTTPKELLSTAELRIRFQSLVEQTFAVLAEVRLLALFLDDLHEADESSLDLIQTLANSKSRMLLFSSVRTEDPEKVERLRRVFSNKSRRVTWITLEPLHFHPVLALVSRTLHRSKEDCSALSRIVYRTCGGNVFSVRNFLTSLHRHRQISFDWHKNSWQFDLKQIEASMMAEESPAFPDHQAYLASHWRELPSEAQRYLIWASFFGSIFRVATVIDWDDYSSSSEEEFESEGPLRSLRVPRVMDQMNLSTTRTSMKGMQSAISEGWLVQRARDMCSFAHDRHHQTATAMAEAFPKETVANMSLRIVMMLLNDDRMTDPYRVAEHAKRCLKLIKEHPIRDDVFKRLFEAGLSAWARGAHELALETLKNARALVIEGLWQKDFYKAMTLHLKLAELYNWRGDVELSNEILEEAFHRVESSEDRSQCLKLRSQNKFIIKEFSSGLEDTLMALELLGLSVNLSPSPEEMDILFEEVMDEILSMGFDRILKIPRTNDPRAELTVQLLNMAGMFLLIAKVLTLINCIGMNAYWRNGDGFSDVSIISLTIIKAALRSGICAGTATGFFWALGAAAERRNLYDFSKNLGRLGLQLAEIHGTSSDKCRALVLYSSMVSGYDEVHVSANIQRCELALKYGLSSGDRLFSEFSLIYNIVNRLFCGEHLSELVLGAEDAVNDIISWTPTSDRAAMAMGVLNLVRALGGYTTQHPRSPTAIFDNGRFKEKTYLNEVVLTSGNVPLILGWYNAFKVVGLYCLGFCADAAELGFDVFESKQYHPNHRHVRFALCYHSLAMINCIRGHALSEGQEKRYMKQINLNQAFIKRWLSHSQVNNGMWIALVDAELASLNDGLDALKLYDEAVSQASSNGWVLEEGWALFLQGSHLVRCGVERLGSELQYRGISQQSQWGANGVVDYLKSVIGAREEPRKESIFSSDVGVQTENTIMDITIQPTLIDDPGNTEGHGGTLTQLASSDLLAILKWSSDISSDMNLFSASRRLTEIAASVSGAQSACVVVARERDYAVATSMFPPTPCFVHENPKSIRTISDPLQRAVIQYCLNSKSRVVFDDTLDSQFASEAQSSLYRAVICLPIFSNRGQTFGAVYLASKYSFLHSAIAILTLLLQQASISISNALLFRSVQAGTRENLRMISSQRAALEEARRSREDALKAAKIKSNFLASMSHELRTPFSSFYGLLDILSDTQLNPGQSEIVTTAKIIDSILDYSKLEASALKLEYSAFSMESLIADCMELLLPMAAKKLDMSFNIEPDVPFWVEADYTRIRQVLMNLIGNAVKFTSAGFVRVLCSVDSTRKTQEGKAYIKFVIQDSGIGISQADKELLFVPFQQADSSSTRKFGGTGLGLSISRQLVKLMEGDIGVDSNLGAGSVFWLSIPVKVHESDESRKAKRELDRLRESLSVLQPRPLRITVSSPSDATLSLLSTILAGFHTTLLKSIEDIEEYIRNAESEEGHVDFFLIDHQSEHRVDELARSLHSKKSLVTTDAKIIHLFTPTSESLSSQQAHGIIQPGVTRMTKPIRTLRLVQTLAALKNIQTEEKNSESQSIVSKAFDDLAAARRILFGRVLIAEDNPVAQKILKQQLERERLIVSAASNGNEAVQEWESHEPGYFSIALFDHHMPLCDGIEACKRIRLLESKRRISLTLPIVALSADCQESTKQLCLSAGMNAFFSKPLKRDDLARLLTMFGASSVGDS
ncbi:hypothetical protein M0805_000314 [Coniferiporia weirii]|nr:hypothetical protein M0805_000314 [Coniferiporia weirii]